MSLKETMVIPRFYLGLQTQQPALEKLSLHNFF